MMEPYDGIIIVTQPQARVGGKYFAARYCESVAAFTKQPKAHRLSYVRAIGNIMWPWTTGYRVMQRLLAGRALKCIVMCISVVNSRSYLFFNHTRIRCRNVCTCTCRWMYMHGDVHAYVCVCMTVYVHACDYACTCTCRWMYMHGDVHAYGCAYIHCTASATALIDGL